MSSPHDLILGGQRSGKSRQAERIGRSWLQQSLAHKVTVVATATAVDDEMHHRIERHRLDRPEGFDTVEAPIHLGAALRAAASPDRLLIVDCLTLWLTNVLMPGPGGVGQAPSDWLELKADMLGALTVIQSPVVLVSNEIGWGVVPMGAEVRHFVDELGRLHQEVAQQCGHITLMVAGQPFTQVVQPWA